MCAAMCRGRLGKLNIIITAMVLYVDAIMGESEDDDDDINVSDNDYFDVGVGDDNYLYIPIIMARTTIVHNVGTGDHGDDLKW